MADGFKKQTGEKAKTAVALSYMPGDAAPKILATGKGAIAERIIETAKEADVPTYKDDKLADTLSRLEIGDMIPPELYEVVAEILVFVNDMDKIRSKLGRWGRRYVCRRLIKDRSEQIRKHLSANGWKNMDTRS